MHRLAWTALLLLVGACRPQQAQPAQPADLSFEGADYKTQAEKIAHGQRLTMVLGCRGCHGENFQGKNMEDDPKQGAMYAPNVSLLLANYSDADLDRLLRRGIPKDGRRFWF